MENGLFNCMFINCWVSGHPSGMKAKKVNQQTKYSTHILTGQQITGESGMEETRGAGEKLAGTGNTTNEI